MKKFEDRRLAVQREMEEKLRRIEDEERQEREKRIAPLVSRLTSLMEEVSKKVCSDSVEDLEFVKFKKAETRKRLEEFVINEISALTDRPEDKGPDADETDGIGNDLDLLSAPETPEQSRENAVGQPATRAI